MQLVLTLCIWLIFYALLYFVFDQALKSFSSTFFYLVLTIVAPTLYTIFFLIVTFQVNGYVFNLLEGVLRKNRFLFIALFIDTLLSFFLFIILEKNIEFTFIVFLPLNVCYIIRIYQEYIFHNFRNYEKSIMELTTSFSLKNEFVNSILDSTVKEDIEIIMRTVGIHLENANKFLPVEEFKITGYFIMRKIDQILKVDSLKLINGNCTVLSSKANVKLLKSIERLNDLIIRESYDIKKISANEEGKLDWGERLIKKILDTKREIAVDKMPENILGIRRMIKLYPTFNHDELECVLVVFKDNFNFLYPEEENAITRIVDDFKIIFSIMRHKRMQEERNRLQSEFEIARQLQTSILPAKTELKGYEYESYMLTASEVGGDTFDIINTEGQGTFFGIGDVSGHGLPAGIMALLQQAAFQASVHMSLLLEHIPLPYQIYNNVNKVLFALNTKRIGSDKFMTQVYLYEREGNFQFAGNHTVALLYKDSAEQVVELDNFVKKVPYLGFIESVDAQDATDSFALEKGDILLMYTDGLTEARNHYDKLFGLDRCKHVLLANAKLSCKEIMDKLLNDLYQFAKEGDYKKHNGHYADDVSLLIFKKQ
jgi:sigma-B regulation protein RsbU (phosphoserine phosphatase)